MRGEIGADVPSFRAVNLPAEIAYVRKIVPEREMANLAFHSWRIPELDAMAWELRALVCTEKLGEKTVSHPATWWDAFKERYRLHVRFPRAFSRPWRIKHTMEAVAYYPALSLPREAHTLSVRVREERFQ